MNLIYTRETKLYAKALFEFALEANILNKLSVEIKELHSFFELNAQELNKLCAPIFSEKQQLHLLNLIITPLAVSNVMRNFLAILIKNNRLKLLEKICSCFNDELLKYKNEKKVCVILAEQISSTEKEEVQQKLAEAFASKVQVNFTEQADILGGIILKYDNKMYDASLKNKFNQLNIIIENKIALL